jgi:hypothetical protein
MAAAGPAITREALTIVGDLVVLARAAAQPSRQRQRVTATPQRPDPAAKRQNASRTSESGSPVVRVAQVSPGLIG